MSNYSNYDNLFLAVENDCEKNSPERTNDPKSSRHILGDVNACKVEEKSAASNIYVGSRSDAGPNAKSSSSALLRTDMVSGTSDNSESCGKDPKVAEQAITRKKSENKSYTLESITSATVGESLQSADSNAHGNASNVEQSDLKQAQSVIKQTLASTSKTRDTSKEKIADVRGSKTLKGGE